MNRARSVRASRLLVIAATIVAAAAMCLFTNVARATDPAPQPAQGTQHPKLLGDLPRSHEPRWVTDVWLDPDTTDDPWIGIIDQNYNDFPDTFETPLYQQFRRESIADPDPHYSVASNLAIYAYPPAGVPSNHVAVLVIVPLADAGKVQVRLYDAGWHLVRVLHLWPSVRSSAVAGYVIHQGRRRHYWLEIVAGRQQLTHSIILGAR